MGDYGTGATVDRGRILQEVMAEQDPTGWRVLVGCMLLNLTTRRQVDRVRGELFERWPDADAMADADKRELRTVLRPLGLHNRRSASLLKMSVHFAGAASVWYGGTQEGPMPESWLWGFPGIGPYAVDSYRIFVLGDLEGEPQSGDKVLARWLENARASRH